MLVTARRRVNGTCTSGRSGGHGDSGPAIQVWSLPVRLPVSPPAPGWAAGRPEALATAESLAQTGTLVITALQRAIVTQLRAGSVR